MNLANQLLTKELKWSLEREYRFFSNKSNKVYSNIVTGIILHKNILETDEANSLISYSKMKKLRLSVWDGDRLVLKAD